MQRNLLLLAYSFPPSNIIGAVRPYQMAVFFKNRGWNVDVISVLDESIADSYNADLSGINSTRIKVPKIVSWLNTLEFYQGKLGGLKTFFFRALKFVIRALIFPDHFIFVRHAYIKEALRIAKDKKYDLLISSALPFSIHSVAYHVADKLHLHWVADNRDLWVASPYRKTLPIWRLFDSRYERFLLGKADLVLGISNSMVDYYREKCGLKNAMFVMNGHSLQAVAKHPADNILHTNDDKIEIIYAGILYNGVRDPSPMLRAIEADSYLQSRTRMRFYGSELDRVAELISTFKACDIEYYSRVSKDEISVIYQGASLLLVILGNGEFENGVLPGKFFEYLSHGKPILAIAADQSELAQVINSFSLGLATRDPERIACFLRSYLAGQVPKVIELPEELSINYHLNNLYQAVQTLPALS